MNKFITTAAALLVTGLHQHLLWREIQQEPPPPSWRVNAWISSAIIVSNWRTLRPGHATVR